MRLSVAGRTEVGKVRDGNEDTYVVDERLALFAVADGMGGHRGGEVASATAIEALRAAVAGGRPIDDAVRSANSAVIEKAEQDPNLTGMGTTLTAAVVVGGASLLIAHVGDSRAYRLRAGNIERLTEDHSLVEELVREGRLTPEQAESHPQRAIVTRALGVDDPVEVDLYTVDVRAGDRVIICSDGLTTMLRERDIESIARTEPDTRLAANKLVEAANDAGGEDNITVVVIDVVEAAEEDLGTDIALEPAATDAAGANATPATPATATGGASPAATVTDDQIPAPRPAPLQSRRRRRAGIAFVLIPVLVIVAVAFGAIAWYDRNNWYLAAQGGQVVLYRGRPDPVLWGATREPSPDVRVADLTSRGRSDVEAKASFTSKSAAIAYMLSATTTSTTTSTTTTTKKPRPTTTTRPRATTSTATP